MSAAPRALLCAAAAVTVVIAGCGARPPQAPLSQAKKLGSATGAIATACGRSYKATAFGPNERRIGQIDAHTRSDARALAEVYRRDRRWIYLGQTVEQISHDAISLTRECGLRDTASVLARETGGGG